MSEDRKYRTRCRFIVGTSKHDGLRPVMANGQWPDPPNMRDVFSFDAYPVMGHGPDDPNQGFFEATPAGQLQLFGVVGLHPRPGATVDIILEFDPEDVLDGNPSAQ